MQSQPVWNKRGQNTAEYAILIALVVGAVIAMQTYVQRAMNGRTFDTARLLTAATGTKTGTDMQYEPYYQDSNFDNDRSANTSLNETGDSLVKNAYSEALKNGYEASTFNRTGADGSNIDVWTENPL